MSIKISQFPCKYSSCDKSYSSKYNLRRHIESSHSKVKRFRCRICGKYLSSKQNLQEHLYTHTQVKPYVCQEPHCGKTFRQSSQLSNHKKLHQELNLMVRQQNELKDFKLTQYYKQFTKELIEYPCNLAQEIVFLPGLSGPQIFICLPRLAQLKLD
ncbi:hypothetical protein SteCoe_19064 [Stentor coeruleus]|uniref:C2H2-type domain-containing protein n=1 Tax=Stentor coeruleus TaxID=5963 RepID=A0A1R2BV02_9CILI|nr:hypothetical protein SteCoe_19064 [Stentor coeruleus]